MSLFVQRCTLPPVYELPSYTPIHYYVWHSPFHRSLHPYTVPYTAWHPSSYSYRLLVPDSFIVPDSIPTSSLGYQTVSSSLRPCSSSSVYVLVRTSTVQPHSTDDDVIPHRSVLQHWCIDLHLRVNFSRGSPRRPLSSHRYQTALWGGFVNLTSPPNVLLSPFTSFFEVVDPIDVSCLNWSGQSKAYNSTPHRTCPFKAPSTAGWRSRY